VVGQQINQMIYIVYGSREIKLVEGQTLPSVQMIVSVLVGYLRTLGRQYGEADDTDVANYKATVQRGAAGVCKALPGWVKVTAAVRLVLGGIGFWTARERIKEVRARDAANEEVTSKAAAEERRVALETRDFDDGIRPELAGKYFIVGENTRLFKDPASAPGEFYIKGGSCVRLSAYDPVRCAGAGQVRRGSRHHETSAGRAMRRHP
jgi:hypothetical protein